MSKILSIILSSPFIQQIALILISVSVTYFITRHQFKKDSLRTYKINACEKLWENTIDFLQEAYPSNDIEKIFESYCKFQSSFFKSNAFLPISLSSKIRFLIYMISDNLKTYNVAENCLREFYSVSQSQHTREFFLRNPNINSAFLDIFSPLTKNIPDILKEIEKEFGKKSFKSKK